VFETPDLNVRSLLIFVIEGAGVTQFFLMQSAPKTEKG